MKTSLLQDLRGQIKREQALLRSPVMKKVLAVASRARRLKNVDVYASISWGGTVTINVNELDGFKDRRLTSVLGRMNDVALEMRTEDEPEYRKRSFVARLHCEALNGFQTLDVTINAYLKDAPRRCRIIEVDRSIEQIPAQTREKIKRIFVCD